MFNKHAKHLFGHDGERTKFGYQLDDETIGQAKSDNVVPPTTALAADNYRKKQLGFVKANYETQRLVLPIQDRALYELGSKANLPMSDIFSFISLRAVTLYEGSMVADKTGIADMAVPSPMITPISLRKSSLDLDEGNNRSVRSFPFIFPLETVTQMYDRVVALEPVPASYEQAGRAMKLVRRFSVVEPFFRRMTMPEYISNYFPLADMPLAIGSANLTSHDLRVPMVPFESTKFAWSNYNGEVQLFLHTDPELIDAAAMRVAYETSLKDVLSFLQSD